MQARSVGSAWEVFAPAKLNLYLEILGRRADGFHELETLMVPVRLYDRLLWEPASADEAGFGLSCHPYGCGRIEVADDGVNLAKRAALLLAQVAGVEPHGKLRLWKRIPIEAGMGGGSSDAAAALLAVNAAWKVGYSRRRLGELAGRLGSDVPFFLFGGWSICRGRGEQLEAVDGLPRLHTVVVKPPMGVSTREAFDALAMGSVSDQARDDSRRRLNRLIGRLRAGADALRHGGVFNRLQHSVGGLNAWLVEIQRLFAGRHCVAHAMTGSGSAYYGLFPSAQRALRFARTLSTMQLGTVYAAATCR